MSDTEPKGQPGPELPTPRPSAGAGLVPWLVAAALAVAAYALRPQLPKSPYIPSPSVLALIAGMALGALPGARAKLGAGAKKISKQAIPYAIVAIGFGLELDKLIESGEILSGLFIVVCAMASAFGGALLFGRLLGLNPRASMLIGAGTAVCGNSAIMAVAPTVEPSDEDVGLSIGVINLLGVVMLFALPPLAIAFGVDGARGGSLAGLTVHAVPQALATGEVFGEEARAMASVYKLIRVAMLVPVLAILALVLTRIRGAKTGGKAASIPTFVVLFMLAAGARAAGFVDSTIEIGESSKALWEWANYAGKFVLAMALAAIGIGLDVKTLLRVGPRMLVVGIAAIVLMVAVTLPLVRTML